MPWQEQQWYYFSSVYLSVCLSFYLCISLPFCLSVYMSMYLFIYLSFCLSVCMSACVPTCVCKTGWPSVYLSCLPVLVSTFTKTGFYTGVSHFQTSITTARPAKLQYIPVSSRTHLACTTESEKWYHGTISVHAEGSLFCTSSLHTMQCLWDRSID